MGVIKALSWDFFAVVATFRASYAFSYSSSIDVMVCRLLICALRFAVKPNLS